MRLEEYELKAKGYISYSDSVLRSKPKVNLLCIQNEVGEGAQDKTRASYSIEHYGALVKASISVNFPEF